MMDDQEGQKSINHYALTSNCILGVSFKFIFNNNSFD